MNEKIVEYAMKRLKKMGEDYDFIPYTTDNYGIYIQFNLGLVLNLSKDEIKYHATEFLNSEIQEINHA